MVLRYLCKVKLKKNFTALKLDNYIFLCYNSFAIVNIRASSEVKSRLVECLSLMILSVIHYAADIPETGSSNPFKASVLLHFIALNSQTK